jgi:hypothetical protein
MVLVRERRSENRAWPTQPSGLVPPAVCTDPGPTRGMSAAPALEATTIPSHRLMHDGRPVVVNERPDIFVIHGW